MTYVKLEGEFKSEIDFDFIFKKNQIIARLIAINIKPWPAKACEFRVYTLHNLFSLLRKKKPMPIIMEIKNPKKKIWITVVAFLKDTLIK